MHYCCTVYIYQLFKTGLELTSLFFKGIHLPCIIQVIFKKQESVIIGNVSDCLKIRCIEIVKADYHIIFAFRQNLSGQLIAGHIGKVVIADACFSGKMRGNKSWEKALASEEVMFFLSSRGEEPSRETKYSNSLFTIYLERGLRGGADVNRDRTITAREIYDFCHTGVIKDSHNKQHPVMWGKFSGDMPIIVWKTNTKEYESTND